MSLTPKPLQTPVPTFVATSTADTVKLAADHGYGVMAGPPFPLESVRDTLRYLSRNRAARRSEARSDPLLSPGANPCAGGRRSRRLSAALPGAHADGDSCPAAGMDFVVQARPHDRGLADRDGGGGPRQGPAARSRTAAAQPDLEANQFQCSQSSEPILKLSAKLLSLSSPFPGAYLEEFLQTVRLPFHYFTAPADTAMRRLLSAMSRYCSCHSLGPLEGEIWTAVTLYSGQLVAQSELSVVTTLACVNG